MKAQSLFDYIFSLTLFITTTFVIIMLTTNFYSDLQNKISSTNSKVRALAISNQMIYLNESFSRTKIIGLNSGKYNELNLTEVINFFNYCNQNKEEIKNFLLTKEFKFKISSYSSYTLPNIPTIKRVVILNDKIEVFEIGITI